VAAYSDNLECPGCKSHLTVWDGSRFLAASAGILAGVLAWQLSSARFNAQGFLAWTLPVLYSFLAFGAVSSVFLMGTADLRLRPDEAVPLPVASEAGHGTHAGAGAHH
jgi:hypothetical protein